MGLGLGCGVCVCGVGADGGVFGTTDAVDTGPVMSSFAGTAGGPLWVALAGDAGIGLGTGCGVEWLMAGDGL